MAQRQGQYGGRNTEAVFITCYGIGGRVPVPFLLRSDNGLVFTSCHYARPIHSYGLKQEFITPYYPQQNRMIERVIRMLKEQCFHRHCFETQQHANAGDRRLDTVLQPLTPTPDTLYRNC